MPHECRMVSIKKICLFIKRLPIIGGVIHAAWLRLNPPQPFTGTASYWQDRYNKGGTSGTGSYGRLCEYKAEIINTFVEKRAIADVIEFGCGDGNQLTRAQYKAYLGFDVSDKAVGMCQRAFATDSTKNFKHMKEYADEKADLGLSLDVIYHLIEDEVFDAYMRRLFEASKHYVIIYASNDEKLNANYGGHHVKHRKFTDWIDRNARDWQFIECVPNRYPFIALDPDNTSLSDFYFYQKKLAS